jgi:hypothetical protein
MNRFRETIKQSRSFSIPPPPPKRRTRRAAHRIRLDFFPSLNREISIADNYNRHVPLSMHNQHDPREN